MENDSQACRGVHQGIIHNDTCDVPVHTGQGAEIRVLDTLGAVSNTLESINELHGGPKFKNELPDMNPVEARLSHLESHDSHSTNDGCSEKADWSRSGFSLWKWETYTIILAAGTLGAIYGILEHFEGQRVPDWGRAINLSTLVAILATILRASLAFVATEIIGQAKWGHFSKGKRPRQLIMISRFDEASRGTYGALQLAPRVFTDPHTLITVLVLITSQAIGSFTQQAIQTQSCQFVVPGVNSSLPTSRNITASASGSGSSTWGPLDIPNLRAALSSSLLAPNDGDKDLLLTVDCLTGNCTFSNSIGGIYSTLGVCKSCVDVTALITSSDWTQYVQTFNVTGANYSLPNGMVISADRTPTPSTGLMVQASRGDLDWAGNLVHPEMEALSKWAFANVTVFTSNWELTNLGYSEYIAATCTLYPCLESYKATIESGKLLESLVSTTPIVPNVIDSMPTDATVEDLENMGPSDLNPMIYGTSPGTHFQAIESSCVADVASHMGSEELYVAGSQRLLLLHATSNGSHPFLIENTTAPTACIYGMDVTAWSDFSSFMMDYTFNGSCSAWSDVENNETQVDCKDAFWLSEFYSDGGFATTDIINRIEAFTQRLSNKIRMGLINDPVAVVGQVLDTTLCTKIDRQWLLFPTILVAVTGGVLLWSIFNCWIFQGRVPLWKNSVLPFIFNEKLFDVKDHEKLNTGKDELIPGQGTKILYLRQMESEAKLYTGRLRRPGERALGLSD